MHYLRKIYLQKRKQIEERLLEFKKTGEASERKIFAELCFCILTPQSRAVTADGAIKRLVKNKLLYFGSEKEIRKNLNGVRFPNNKALYIVEIRARFIDKGQIKVKEYLNEKNIYKLREKLVKDVKGYGLKEASHFLRNTGRGKNIAILDRHILSELVKNKVIIKIPDRINKKKYIEIEGKMKDFAKDIKVPLDALDLLFWYQETGYFFK